MYKIFKLKEIPKNTIGIKYIFPKQKINEYVDNDTPVYYVNPKCLFILYPNYIIVFDLYNNSKIIPKTKLSAYKWRNNNKNV